MTAHVCSGLALGSLWPGPAWTAAPAATVAHALLDAVPHWDYTRSRLRIMWATLDVAAAAALLVAAGRRAHGRARGGAALVAGAAAALPDLDVIDGLLPRRRMSAPRADISPRTRWFPSHFHNFPHGEASPLVGTATQLVTMAVSVLIFLGRTKASPTPQSLPGRQ